MFIIITDHEHKKRWLFCDIIFTVISFFLLYFIAQTKRAKIKFKYRHTTEMLLLNFLSNLPNLIFYIIF